MNPLPFVTRDGQLNWWVVAGLAAFALYVRWHQRREERRRRRDPDRGGAGYTPADLRGHVPVPERPAPPADPEEAWLLALPAPFVEQAGLDHDALGPASA